MKPTTFPVLIAALLLATTAVVLVNATHYIVDVSGSAGDLASLRLLTAHQSASITLITVSGTSGTSAMAAWSRVRRFANWIGLHQVEVALGSITSWSNRKAIDVAGTSDTIPGCNDAWSFVAPTPPPAASTTSNWGRLYNTFDLDDWFGKDDALQPPLEWMSSVLPEGITSTSTRSSNNGNGNSGNQNGNNNAKWAQTPSPAVRAMRDVLSSSAVQVEYIALASLTNLADYLALEEEMIKEINRRQQDHIPIDPTRNAQDALLFTTYKKLSAVHISAGCVDADACVFRTLTGSSRARVTGDWNLAMDPTAAEYVLSAFSVPSGSESSVAPTIDRFVYTADVIYNGGTFDAASFLLVSSRLKQMSSASSSPVTAVHGGTGPLVWLGDAFSAIYDTWTKRAFAYLAGNGAGGIFNALRPTEMLVSLAVVDNNVRRSLEVQPRAMQVQRIRSGGELSVVDAPPQQPPQDQGTPIKKVPMFFTQGPSSMIPFWQRFGSLMGLT